MIVRLNGGLGNQLFQYAFGVSVAQRRNEQVFFEKHQLDGGAHRAYSLDAFCVNVRFLNGAYLGPKYEERIFNFDPGVYNAARNAHFVGNWQTEKYFNEPAVREDFRYKRPMSQQTNLMASVIQTRASASIHVRRSDYLIPSTAAYHGNMGLEYYGSAIAYIKARVPGVHFFIFSDDPQWCKQAFPTADFTIVDHNGWGNGLTGPAQEHEDLYLMSLCNHAIIPNSSFGWWGAWLNPDKQRIVIAPKRWFIVQHLCTDDIIPDRWVKI